jgi:hypothetical protein
MMERLFRLSNRQTTVRTEVLGWRDDVFDDGLHNLRSARCAFWKNVRHAYGPGVWCRHDIDMFQRRWQQQSWHSMRAIRSRRHQGWVKTSSLFSQRLPPRQQRASEWVAGRARRGVRFRLFLILSLIGLRELIQRSCSRDQLVTYLPAIVLVVYFAFMRSRMG